MTICNTDVTPCSEGCENPEVTDPKNNIAIGYDAGRFVDVVAPTVMGSGPFGSWVATGIGKPIP